MSLFKTKWLGLNKVSAAFNKATAGVAAVMGVKALEEHFLKLTKDRFLPRGAAPTAQMAPDGTPWAAPSKVTLERRKSNRNAAQAMFDSGELENDIVVLGSKSASYTGSGFIKIGLRPGSKAVKYIGFLEDGGVTPQGRPVPPRKVFGTSADEMKSLGASIFERLAGFLR